MKGVNARFLIAAILLAGSSSACPTLASEDDGRPAYIVTNLPSLGGAVSSGNSLNDLGWRRAPRTFQGTSPSTRPCGSNGRRIDLGTLGGPISGVIRPVKNDRG